MNFSNNTFRRLVISFSLVFCVLLACGEPLYGSPHSNRPRQVKLDQPFDLEQLQEAQLKGSNIRVKLVEVNDSRCPKDVECVWAGNGAVKLEISRGGRNRQTITLNTAKTSALPGEQEFAGYKMSLLALNPYPVSARGMHWPKQVATLTISKLGRR